MESINYFTYENKDYFKNKHILITGATGGIGKVLVNTLYNLDANMCLISHDEDKLKTTGKRVLKSAIDTWAGHTIDWQNNPVSSVTTPYFSDYRAGAEYNTVSGRTQMRSRAHEQISGFRAVYAIGPKRPPENYAWSYSVSIDEEETSDEGYNPEEPTGE